MGNTMGTHRIKKLDAQAQKQADSNTLREKGPELTNSSHFWNELKQQPFAVFLHLSASDGVEEESN